MYSVPVGKIVYCRYGGAYKVLYMNSNFLVPLSSSFSSFSSFSPRRPLKLQTIIASP